MERTSVVDVPELVSIIASWLSPHDLTLCIRVDKTWSDGFLPFLYQNIKVIDFDLYSHRSRRVTRYPEHDHWHDYRTRQQVDESRLQEMNLLGFKVFSREVPSPKHEGKEPGDNSENSEVISSSLPAPAPTPLPGSTSGWYPRMIDRAQLIKRNKELAEKVSQEAKENPERPPRPLFPNMTQSPLTSGADPTRPIGCFSKAVQESKKPVGFGGKYVHKYSQFIRTLTVAHPFNLRYLGKHCKNLTELSVYSWTAFDKTYRFPLTTPETTRWQNFWISRNCEKMLQTWIDVLERNPHLRIVRFELSLVPIGGLARFAMALSKLKNLQEVQVFDSGVDRRIEVLLDHCPSSIPKLTWTVIAHQNKTDLQGTTCLDRQRRWTMFGRYRVYKGQNIEKLDEPRGEELGGTDGRPTRIQTLDLLGLTSQIPEDNMRRVFARTPHVKRVQVPSCAYARLQVATLLSGSPETTQGHTGNMITRPRTPVPWPLVERIDLTIPQKSVYRREFEMLFQTLPNFKSLGVSGMATEFALATHLRDQAVKDRLLEYEERLGTSCSESRGMQLCVKRLCQNLRVLDLGSRPVHILDYFSIQWGCQESLVRLRISVCCDATTIQTFKGELSNSRLLVSSAVSSPVCTNENSASEAETSTNIEERSSLQRRIMSHLSPLTRLEKLNLARGFFMEAKLTSFPFVMDQKAMDQIREFKCLKELVVHD
ncbi:hypothetical protein BGZ83_001519, partial [Gryganskiella cystojenkinii]